MIKSCVLGLEIWTLALVRKSTLTTHLLVCLCVGSDKLCGMVHCSVDGNKRSAHFQALWTAVHNRQVGSVECTSASYQTFYNGPDKPDPGLVPDGAACGTGKVITFSSRACEILQLTTCLTTRTLLIFLVFVFSDRLYPPTVASCNNFSPEAQIAIN